jgi:putative membrane protein
MKSFTSRVAAILLVALLATGATSAFSSPAKSDNARAKPTTALASTTKDRLPKGRPKIYGEESRKYRRTVYTHDDWVKHRSSDRFFKNLAATTSSGVFKNMADPVLAATSVATLLVVWNGMVGGYTDFQGTNHAALLPENPLFFQCSIPLAMFLLSSPSLGLLLVFRTNTAYQRWDEARKNWGMNINHTRDLVRMACAYYDREGVPRHVIQQDLERVALTTWSFVRAMQRHLSPAQEDEKVFAKELHEKLPARQAQAILDAAHRPNRALQGTFTTCRGGVVRCLYSCY